VPDRVVVFLDWQNVYRSAREAFCGLQAPHWEGQVNPVRLAQHLAADSPFDRQLKQVLIYRGQPDASKDRKGYASCSRQVGIWRQSPLVSVTTRTLRYPHGWPNPYQPGERPQEKGIDVALAIDFVVMAVRREYEVGILMSTDTDLKPALEAVAALTSSTGQRAEVAAWSVPGRHDRRLAISSRNLYCHWMGENVYNQVADAADYSKGT
jgi:NYN domain